jgi:uncharacterized membrane protein YbhN (UPF0104 family)
MAMGWTLRSKIRVLLGVILSAAGLFLAVRGVDWPALAAELRGVHLGWLGAAVAAELLTLGINAVRWRWLFWPHYRPGVGRLFGILNVAQLANAVLPGRLGLAFRILLVGEGGQVNRATALTTLATEKTLEGVTLLPVGVLLFLVLDLPDWLRLSALLSGGLILGLIVVMGCGIRWREPFLAWLSGWATSRLTAVAGALFDGLEPLSSLRIGWRAWVLSLAYWAVAVVVIGTAMRAVGVHLSLIANLTLLFVLQVGGRLPSSPGNIGVFHYLGVVSLSFFGIERAPALGAMLVLHMIVYLPASVAGAAYLLWTSTGFGQLRRAALALHEP